MKTDNNNSNIDIERVLADLEHAGRDARRQQALGDMIERLAADESRRHSKVVRLWIARVAAAACVLFFIATGVRIWFIPTEPAGNTMVAGTEIPVVVTPADSTFVAPPAKTTPNVSRNRHAAVQVTAAPEIVLQSVEESPVEETPMVQEYIAEEVIVEEEVEEDSSATDIAVSPQVAAPEPLVAANEEEEKFVKEEVEPVKEEPEHKEVRRRIFSSLFRRADPSKMDGTVLAFNIL